ncbi:galactokinase [Congregibacter variabilis]|uniref:Galactokinase n=1 Tax=Congregibacter variabilis TaxID=3081200 RepID=A0ABZ0I4W5_9GAMM|nr:galactokinase [Congregibacter sp. IMCC43200]
MTDSVTALLQALGKSLEKLSTSKPVWAAQAPGRVNLIGDHTDYSQGFALPMGVNLYTLAIAAPGAAGSDAIRILSTREGEAVLPLDGENPRRGDWTDYLRGVLEQYRKRNVVIPAMDVVIGGNLPLGAGLSSSASLELCFATLVELASAHPIQKMERALLCQQAEHDYAGVPCGILDQFAVSFAKENQAMLLDCRERSIQPVNIPSQLRVAIVDSGVSHALADGGYATRRAQVEAAQAQLGSSLRDACSKDLVKITDDTIRARARHVISENERVLAFAQALKNDDMQTAGQLMYASHESLSRDFAVSCDELDTLVEAAREAGAIGARMTGGGFGGSMIAFVDIGGEATFERIVSKGFTDAGFGYAQIRWVTAVAGAQAWEWI